MFRGSSEEETFETSILRDDSEKRRIRAVKKEESGELLLPDEAKEKLNRCLLEASMEWLKGKGGAMEWKVIRDGLTIRIYPAPAKKGNR